MDLFMFSDTVGKGFADVASPKVLHCVSASGFLAPHPGPLRLSGSNVSTHRQQNCFTSLPAIMQKYGKDSFQPIHTPEEGEEYFLKPMNCPHHCMIYKNSPPFLQKTCLYVWQSSVRFAVTSRVASCTV